MIRLLSRVLFFPFFTKNNLGGYDYKYEKNCKTNYGAFSGDSLHSHRAGFEPELPAPSEGEENCSDHHLHTPFCVNGGVGGHDEPNAESHHRTLRKCGAGSYFLFNFQSSNSLMGVLEYHNGCTHVKILGKLFSIPHGRKFYSPILKISFKNCLLSSGWFYAILQYVLFCLQARTGDYYHETSIDDRQTDSSRKTIL